MNNATEWPMVAQKEIHSGYLPMGIRISCSIPLTGDEQRIVVHAIDKIFLDIESERIKNDPAMIQQSINMVDGLVMCFTKSGITPVYVEKIPNEYSNQPWCIPRPWLIVTTQRGRVKIGWRKRVINIDWSDSKILANGDTLFESERVTRGDRYVHADSYEKATEYLKMIFA